MKIGKYEFGLVKPFGWYGFSKSDDCGCVIYTFGCFFLTVLSKQCTEGESPDDIVSVEPLARTSLLGIAAQLERDLYTQVKAQRREKKSSRKRTNKGKALGKRKKKSVRSSKGK
jgi:hypothetical protein